MNRLLASLVALVLLVSPVTKAMAGCCPEMVHAAFAVPENAGAEVPPCHSDMSMDMDMDMDMHAAMMDQVEPADHANACGHSVDCCGAIAALVVEINPMLAREPGYARSPQPEYAPLAKHPEALLRPPSIG